MLGGLIKWLGVWREADALKVMTDINEWKVMIDDQKLKCKASDCLNIVTNNISSKTIYSIPSNLQIDLVPCVYFFD